MKKLMRWLLSLLLVAAAMATVSGSVFAAILNPPPPTTLSPRSAIPQIDPPADLTGLWLPTLKAVLVVGTIDGPTGFQTQLEVSNMKLAETELKASGVNVIAFYPPNDDWATIKAASTGAQFFYYRGHGISDGNTPPNVGGLWLTSGYVSSSDLRQMRLATGAIVMISACYASGSSTDTETLTSAEAQRRIVQYSEPFFAAGASAYYANWQNDAFEAYSHLLALANTYAATFEAYNDYNPNNVERYAYPGYPGFVLWADKDFWDGGYKYDNTFAGDPNASLASFGSPVMQVVPNPVVFAASKNHSAFTAHVTIRSSAVTSMSFQWNATFEGGSWASLTTSSGSMGGQVAFKVNSAGLGNGTYTGTLHVHSSTPGVGLPDQDIPVKLVVLPYAVFVPLATTH